MAIENIIEKVKKIKLINDQLTDRAAFRPNDQTGHNLIDNLLFEIMTDLEDHA